MCVCVCVCVFARARDLRVPVFLFSVVVGGEERERVVVQEWFPGLEKKTRRRRRLFIPLLSRHPRPRPASVIAAGPFLETLRVCHADGDNGVRDFFAMGPSDEAVPWPPACLRVAPGAFTRLAFLTYGARGGAPPLDLGAWVRAKYRLPSLKWLSVFGRALTGADQDGRDWATVLTVTLPKLEILSLQSDQVPAEGPPPPSLFACRTGDVRPDGEVAYYGCGALEPCAGVEAVRAAVLVELPAAYEAAGRRLEVKVRVEFEGPTSNDRWASSCYTSCREMSYERAQQ